MTGFPTRSPSALEQRPLTQQWLVAGLWGRQAVGIIGGEPKCGKSFLALDLAVAVAAGVPCLRRFETDQPGPVLMFAAEDAGHIVRTRLQGIARAADADFASLDIAVIDVPVVRLDHRNDRQRLEHTVQRIRPRLVLLDPLVRLHGVDENAVAEIAPILGFLRDLQRRFETAEQLAHLAVEVGEARGGMGQRCDAQPLGAFEAIGEQAKGGALSGAGLAGDEGEAAGAHQMVLDAAAEAVHRGGGDEGLDRKLRGEGIELQPVEGEQFAVHEVSPRSLSSPGSGVL